MNPGDKVVCVDDNWSTCPYHPAEVFSAIPVAGRVYVVSSVGESFNGTPGLKLVGIHSLTPHCVFRISRFRLLSEMKLTAINKQYVEL